MINARSEEIARSYKPALKSRRCLIPASGWYEWREKQPYRFSRPDGELQAFAGLWEQWQDLTSFTIFTTGYQLFHALAATAKLGQAKDATHGVLLIHEFVSLTLDFDKFVQNANDLNQFIQEIPGWESQKLKCGVLLPPIQLPGSVSVPNDVLISVGKIRTLIPLGAGGRAT